MILIPLIAAAFFALIIFYYDQKYKKTAYYKNTQLPYLSVLNNSGRYGEYLMYTKLSKLERQGARFLFNVYIPKSNGETTEIDMIMICSKGIFIFESKNYSGWIFGNESQTKWYQTLPTGKGKSHKEAFYNPIMQNKAHIEHLYEYIEGGAPIYSVIVFSDRCTLKNVQIESDDVGLVYLSELNYAVLSVLNQDDNFALDEDYTTMLYNKLYPCSQVSDEQKAQHIQRINANKNSKRSDRR